MIHIGIKLVWSGMVALVGFLALGGATVDHPRAQRVAWTGCGASLSAMLIGAFVWIWSL